MFSVQSDTLNTFGFIVCLFLPSAGI